MTARRIEDFTQVEKLKQSFEIYDGAIKYSLAELYPEGYYIPIGDVCCLSSKENNSSIKKVIFNEPATIVFWDDGTKTVVKTSSRDIFDKEKGILWAYFIKHYGNSKTKCQKLVKSICGYED